MTTTRINMELDAREVLKALRVTSNNPVLDLHEVGDEDIVSLKTNNLGEVSLVIVTET